jgi:hypothetical protein
LLLSGWLATPCENVLVTVTRKPRKELWRWLAIGWISLAVVTAALVGQMSEGPGDDYWLRPIALSRVVSVLVVSIAAFSLGSTLLRIRKSVLHLPRMGLAGLAGTAMLSGFGYRLVTAAVGGANIGGALFVMFIGPVMLVWFVLSCVSIRKSLNRLDL